MKQFNSTEAIIIKEEEEQKTVLSYLLSTEKIRRERGRGGSLIKIQE
jgi:hypothetical protein